MPTTRRFVSYGGYEYDLETGLYHIGYRYYDPEIGRFLSIDPEGFGLNWYAYALNDPINLFDWFGLEPEPFNGVTMGFAPIDWLLRPLGEAVWNYGYTAGEYDAGKVSGWRVAWEGGKFGYELGTTAIGWGRWVVRWGHQVVNLAKATITQVHYRIPRSMAKVFKELGREDLIDLIHEEEFLVFMESPPHKGFPKWHRDYNRKLEEIIRQALSKHPKARKDVFRRWIRLKIRQLEREMFRATNITQVATLILVGLMQLMSFVGVDDSLPENILYKGLKLPLRAA
ncbi:MAG: RHS repeat-associated core domain-containing protein [Thermoproteota archaeon]